MNAGSHDWAIEDILLWTIVPIDMNWLFLWVRFTLSTDTSHFYVMKGLKYHYQDTYYVSLGL
jgi:hypothetical protein